jgi:tRNA (guanine10-N2)-dimethyltransferase
VRLAFELSGEHPTLPAAEALAALEVLGGGYEVGRDGTVLFAEASAPSIPDLAARLGLCHVIGQHLASCAPTEEAILAAVQGIAPRVGPSFRVRAHRIGEHGKAIAPTGLERNPGALLAPGRRVVLDGPAEEVRILLGAEAHLTLRGAAIDRTPFDARHVRHRPHFSPVALHPRFARCLVNLARVQPGDKVCDPFTGTGGVLAEAALVGARVVGGDLDPAMVEGSRAFLAQVGAEGEVLQADVAETLAKAAPLDAVCSDPPYGRASWTAKEQPPQLYRRALAAMAEAVRPGGRVALVVPDPTLAQDAPPALVMEQAHVQRVHRSLDRHYLLFRRR